MAIRLLHLSDLHFDCGFKTKKSSVAFQLRQAQYGAFKEAIRLAHLNQCHIVALTGDIFDDKAVSFRSEEIVIKGLRSLLDQGIYVVYLTGNHDYHGLKRGLRQLEGHPQFIIFDQPEPTVRRFLIEGTEIALVGSGHHMQGIHKNWAKVFPKAEPGVLTIGFYHGMVQGGVMDSGDEAPYMACSLDDLQQKQYHYFALGHLHKRQIIADKIAYSGCLQAISKSESVKKGGWLVDIDFDSTELTFLPCSQVEFRDIRLYFDSAALDKSLFLKIKEAINKILDSEEGALIIRVFLIGLLDLSPIQLNEILEDYLLTYPEERVLDIELDLTEWKPVASSAILESPYIQLSLEMLNNPAAYPEFLANLERLEKSGIPAMKLIESDRQVLQTKLLHYFMED